jgi:hypothetical protein
MQLKVFLFLVIISFVSFAVTGCAAEGDCPDCKILKDALQARMFLSIDSSNHTITASVYYENISMSPPRQPVNFSKIIVNVYNGTFSDNYIIYTDSTGVATYDFSEYKDIAVSFKFLYCPFSNPNVGEAGYSQCGFIQCIEFAGIECTLPNCQITDIQDADPAKKPASESYFDLLPVISTLSYNPPAEPLLSTPAICLPALIIFALLGGALFISGRNPFAGFDFSAPRLGRHIRYQARGRGAGISAPTFVQQYIMSKASGALAKGTGKVLSVGARVIGGKKRGKAAGQAIKRGITGGAGEAGMAVRVGGQVIRIGAGRRKGKGAAKMMDFIKGGKVSPIAKYKTAWGAKEAWRGAVATYQGVELAGAGINLSFPALQAIALSMGNFDRAVEVLRKTSGSQFSFQMTGVREAMDPFTGMKGIQIVNSKGNPIKIKVNGKNADVILNSDALRTGQISGQIAVGEQNFQLDNGQVVGVSEAGKALAGNKLKNAIKSFDMKGFNDQLAKAPISMETRMFSKEFGGDVTVKFNPISVGSTGNFEVIKPGADGRDASGISTTFKAGKVDSITNLANKQTMTEIKGTKIGIGSKATRILNQTNDSHQAYDNVIAAQQNFAKSTTMAAGEAYANRNPNALKALDKLSQGIGKKLDAAGVTGTIKNYAMNADHVGIETRANTIAQTDAQSTALASLGKKSMDAYSKYMKERSKPGASEQDAWKKYVEPVIERNKDKFESAYMATYIESYKKQISDGYLADAKAQAARAGETLSKSEQAKIRNRAYDIARKFMDRGALPEHIASKLGTPLTNFRKADELDQKKDHFDNNEAYKAIGNAVKSGAKGYRDSRNNPNNYSAQELALGGISLQSPSVKGIRYDASKYQYRGSIDTEAVLKVSPTKSFARFLKSVGKLPKKKQNEMYFKAVYNLPQAAKEAAQLAKKQKKKS